MHHFNHPWALRSRSLACGLIAICLFTLTVCGCASKPKPPSTVKEFLAQPRPK
jgi:hypothetical protein